MNGGTPLSALLLGYPLVLASSFVYGENGLFQVCRGEKCETFAVSTVLSSTETGLSVWH